MEILERVGKYGVDPLQYIQESRRKTEVRGMRRIALSAGAAVGSILLIGNSIDRSTAYQQGEAAPEDGAVEAVVDYEPDFETLVMNGFKDHMEDMARANGMQPAEESQTEAYKS